jgi:hypothetical protein
MSLNIKVPKQQPGANIDVKNEKLFKLPTLAVFTGQAGRGKTTAAANLLRMFHKENLCDRVILISPTTSSNNGMWKELGLPVTPEDTIDPNDPNAVSNIINIVNEERDGYAKYLDELDNYKKMQEKLSQGSKLDITTQKTVDKLVTIKQGQPHVSHPKSMHKHGGKKPVIWAFFDDCQGSKVFNPKNGLGREAIQHRHQGSFESRPEESPLGLSMVFTVQNFRDRVDGIPKVVRTNAHLIAVFYTKDEKERQAIAEEASGVTDKDTLLDRLDQSTEPFSPDFLLIDKHPINPSSKLGVFRKCFEGPVEPPPEVSTGKKRKRGNG